MKEILLDPAKFGNKALKKVIDKLLAAGYHVRFELNETGRLPERAEAARFDRR